jgi:hypothetical protein
MNRFTRTLCIILVIAVGSVMAEDDDFDLGDLIEIVSLMPIIIDGIVSFLAICQEDGIGVALVCVSLTLLFTFIVTFIIIAIFKPCFEEFSKKKYQPLRIALNLCANDER